MARGTVELEASSLVARIQWFVFLFAVQVFSMTTYAAIVVPSAAEPVIIDSDGAVFWDDGAALAMLLQHPKKVKILGITTVLGNHWPLQAAEYLGRVLKAANRTDVPIFVGASEPLKNGLGQIKKIEDSLILQQLTPKTGFWKGAYSRPSVIRLKSEVEPAAGESRSGVEPRAQAAVDFIVETLLKSKRAVTIVAIGPLTNIAQALQRNPKIVSKIKRILVMGGNVRVAGNTTPFAELNFFFDPEAAQIVLSSGIAEKLLFPLDLSNQGVMDKSKYEKLIAVETPYSVFLKADRGPKFVDPKYTIQPWDALVSAYLVDSSYVTASELVSLRVITEPTDKYGSISLEQGKLSQVRVMTEMNFEKFFSILKDSFGSQPAAHRHPDRQR